MKVRPSFENNFLQTELNEISEVCNIVNTIKQQIQNRRYFYHIL